MGYKVGLLDADIHGPSIPKMFHTEGFRPVSTPVNGRNLIEPIEQYGVKMLSIGFFVDPQQAVVWRGGMASNAIKQLILDANWGELDYFLIDLPPGTSDIHLSLVQHLQLTGAIVVTTPQPVALVDARKGVDMFQNEKINVPVLGLVENMAWFTPAELPNNRYYIFGKDGGKELAEELNIPLLGQVPLVQSIREGGDEGMPIAMQDGHPAAQMFAAICKNLLERQ
jgi:ATP-binding protein involved in chromosome partitioning